MSQAYASTLRISFDLRGGLLIRQIHHSAADLFMAAIIVHMLRVFFTGAYRKPQDRLADQHRAVHPRPARGPASATHCPTMAVKGRPPVFEGILQGLPRRRHLPGVLPVRRAIPRARHRAEDVHPARAADPRPAAGADQRPPVHHVPPEGAIPAKGNTDEHHRPAVLPLFHRQGRRRGSSSFSPRSR